MEKLREKVRESLSSVLPITIIVLLLSIVLIPMEVGAFTLFLAGALFLIFGMGFFQLGADISMTQLGQGIGGQLMKKRNLHRRMLPDGRSDHDIRAGSTSPC